MANLFSRITEPAKLEDEVAVRFTHKGREFIGRLTSKFEGEGDRFGVELSPCAILEEGAEKWQRRESVLVQGESESIDMLAVYYFSKGACSGPEFNSTVAALIDDPLVPAQPVRIVFNMGGAGPKPSATAATEED